MRCKNVFYLLVAASLAFASLPARADDMAVLGTAASFAVLAGSTVTNTGPSTIYGNLGVSPGTAVTGFPPGLVTGGTIHSADAVAGQAQSDLTTAYNSLAGMPSPPANNLTGQDLGGKTLVAGVYKFTSSAGLTGTLTLNAQGNPNAVFVFQIGSTLITASNSAVRMINGANPCNVYWQVGSSATLGTNTQFLGNILALTSIGLNTGATIGTGRALARNGAVTLNTNVISIFQCMNPPPPNTPADTTCPTVTWFNGHHVTPNYYTVTDTGSGLLSIIATKLVNATIVIPSFTVGTKSPVTVYVNQTVAGVAFIAEIRVTDVLGNSCVYDPLVVPLTRKTGNPVTLTFRNLPYAEHYMKVYNFKPGLEAIEVEVNGTKFTIDKLKDNEVRSLDVLRMMKSGNNNTMSFTAVGKPGGSGEVELKDVK